eukprot:361377-Chlamydomonas_euryale.AAC.5
MLSTPTHKSTLAHLVHVRTKWLERREGFHQPRLRHSAGRQRARHTLQHAAHDDLQAQHRQGTLASAAAGASSVRPGQEAQRACPLPAIVCISPERRLHFHTAGNFGGYCCCTSVECTSLSASRCVAFPLVFLFQHGKFILPCFDCHALAAML